MNFRKVVLTTLASLFTFTATVTTSFAGGGSTFPTGDPTVVEQTIHFTNTASQQYCNKQFVMRFVLSENDVNCVYKFKRTLSPGSQASFTFPQGSIERSISVQAANGKWYSSYVSPLAGNEFTSRQLIQEGRGEDLPKLRKIKDDSLYHRTITEEELQEYQDLHFARATLN